jgi:hypothetical protein
MGDCLTLLRTLSRDQPKALIVAQPLACSWITRLYHFQIGDYGAQVSTKALDSSRVVPVLFFAPTRPGAVEHFALNAMVGADHASFANKGTYRTG